MIDYYFNKPVFLDFDCVGLTSKIACYFVGFGIYGAKIQILPI
jgi:hypothetical protein